MNIGSVVTHQSRLIAFLDVLGFSARLETQSLSDLHREYSELIDEARTAVMGPDVGSGTNFARAQFLYDSIVLVSHPVLGDDGPKNVFHFVGAVAQLLENAFGRRMPLRGAIAFGDFLDDEGRGVFLSPVFPSLVRAERSQDWCGVVVLQSALEQVLGGLYGSVASDVPRTAAGLVIEYPAPLKAAGAWVRERFWCVNWVWFADTPKLTEPFTWIEEPKRSETALFIRHVESLPAESAELSTLPDALKPAVRVRFQMARAGWRMKFLDTEGCGVDPPEGTKINFQVVQVPTSPRELGGAG